MQNAYAVIVKDRHTSHRLHINKAVLISHDDKKHSIAATSSKRSGARHLATEPNTKFFKCCASIEVAFEQYWHTISFSSLHRGYLEGQ